MRKHCLSMLSEMLPQFLNVQFSNFSMIKYTVHSFLCDQLTRNLTTKLVGINAFQKTSSHDMTHFKVPPPPNLR